MGGIKFVPQLDNFKKMKLSVALFAAAQANPTQWMVDQWWNEAVDVFNFSNNNWAAFSKAVNSVDDSQWQPLWNFCNADGDAELSSTELTSCGPRAANYLGMPQAHQNFLYNFAGKYWSVIDQDGSGGLNYDEYRYTFGGFAATDAGVILAGFDADSNGKLDATIQCLSNAWANADQNGNQSDATRQEIALFTL